jgi:outer membrane biosynthesis protein TonB
MPHRLQSLLVLGLLLILVASCGSTNERASQLSAEQPTTLPDPTATVAPPTATPTPTDTSIPTATPVPPTDTPVPPTDTPTPSDTPEPTHTPTPSDTPQPTKTPVPSNTPAPTKTRVPPTATLPPPTKTPAPSPTPVPTKPPQAKVVIVQVYNDHYDEHVVITNNGNAPADMSGWTVSGSRGDETYHYPAGYTLAPGATMRLYSGKNGINNPPSAIYWTDKTVWNNDGEIVYLRNAQGSLVDDYSY